MHLSRLPLAAMLLAAPLQAQDVAAMIARGDSAYAVFNADDALSHYESALAVDSLNADALGKASRTAILM